MRFCVLASGSGGNATYVAGGGVRVLIDAGLSCRELEKRLESQGLDPNGLDGILITHEHVDHVNGLSRFVARHPVPVFANEGTAAVVERQCRLAKRPVPEFAIFESSVPFLLGDLTVLPVRISHDTAEPVGFTFSDGETQFGFFTDLGIISRDVALAAAHCRALVLESNHDVDMLCHSGRPYALISRIAGASGHLSNEQAAELIRQMCPVGLKRLVLAHLSGECNQPAVAEQVMRTALREVGREDVQLCVAQQDQPLELMEV